MKRNRQSGRYKYPVPSLYEKSVAAMKRYSPKSMDRNATSEIARAMNQIQRDIYRIGWMIGFRAGYRAASEKKKGKAKRKSS